MVAQKKIPKEDQHKKRLKTYWIKNIHSIVKVNWIDSNVKTNAEHVQPYFLKSLTEKGFY